ncbi:MAG: hypothetical protein PHN56_04420 [Candidatus Nanoarchaeia archaeon]|nr:hypothetical protein [Candidatus Nanoarchaeia archaeon]
MTEGIEAIIKKQEIDFKREKDNLNAIHFMTIGNGTISTLSYANSMIESGNAGLSGYFAVMAGIFSAACYMNYYYTFKKKKDK